MAGIDLVRMPSIVLSGSCGKINVRLNPDPQWKNQLDDTQNGFVLVTLGVWIPSGDLSVYNIRCVLYSLHPYALPARGWL